MAIVINGSGTVTGLAVGGLPDGTVDSGTIATGTIVDADVANLAASKLTGALPAISGASLTGITTGKILQVVQTFAPANYSSTATTFTDITGLSVSITPSATTSKILVSYYLGTVDTNADGRVGFRIMRDSTAVGVGTAAGSRLLATTATTNTTQRGTVHSFQYLDSPATTSAITYKIQQYNQGNTMTLGIRNSNDPDGASVYRTPNNIIVMEIGA